MGNDLTTKMGALWVQPDGPNTEVHFLGCHGLDEIAESMGAINLLRCFKPDGTGWNVTGQTVDPPDPVTFTINTRLRSTRSWMQKLDCPFSFYALQRDCGRADEFSNYVRGDVLKGCRVVNKTKGGVAAIEGDEESTLGTDVEAWPPVLEIPNLVIDRLTADTLAVTGAYCAVPNMNLRCYGDCGDKLKLGEQILMVGESAAGPLLGEFEFSSDSGATFTDTANDPFAAGAGSFSGTRFSMGRDGWRWMLWKETEAGTQGEIAYCDDLLGTTWTSVNIGGAAAAEGSVWGQGAFSLHSKFIFIAGANGSIWKSTDAALTWTQVEAGVIHAGNYNCVHFSDESYGMAGGAADIIAVTSDGGITWSAATPTGGGGDIKCCWRFDKNRMWVGTDDGEIFFTRDGGTTWTERTGWVGTGVGSVNGMSWYDDHYGFIVSDTAAPVGTVLRTINGGYDWETITTPTNSGLTHIACVSPDLAYGTGLANGGSSFYFKVRESA
jgi:hypothetical protein